MPRLTLIRTFRLGEISGDVCDVSDLSHHRWCMGCAVTGFHAVKVSAGPGILRRRESDDEGDLDAADEFQPALGWR